MRKSILLSSALICNLEICFSLFEKGSVLFKVYIYLKVLAACKCQESFVDLKQIKQQSVEIFFFFFVLTWTGFFWK